MSLLGFFSELKFYFKLSAIVYHGHMALSSPMTNMISALIKTNFFKSNVNKLNQISY